MVDKHIKEVNAIANKMGYDSFNALQKQMADADPVRWNEFVSNLYNKVIVQKVLDHLFWEDPFIKHFYKGNIPYGDSVEVMAIQPDKATDYEIKEWRPHDFASKKVVRQLIITKKKRDFHYWITYEELMSAMVNATAFASFVAKYTGMLSNEVAMDYTELFRADLIADTKNVLDVKSEKTLEDKWNAIFKHMDAMKLYTKKYNLGFAKPESESDELTSLNTSNPKDLILFAHPNIITELKTKILSNKFHNSYWKIDQYGGYEVLDIPADTAYILDKRAFHIYNKVDTAWTNAYARNKSIYVNRTVGRAGALVKFMNGFKITGLNVEAEPDKLN